MYTISISVADSPIISTTGGSRQTSQQLHRARHAPGRQLFNQRVEYDDSIVGGND